jgi:hypothetical protein
MKPMNQMNPMQAFSQFMQNPAAAFQRSGLPAPPQSAMQSPDSMIQYLMNSGLISQDQYNQAAAKARECQSNPQFMQMMQGFFRR